MAKKGIRFQTKLILAMGFTVLIVTVAILAATERRVRRAYTRNFEADFSVLATGIDESRESRSRGFMALSAKLAKHSFVIDYLKQKSSPGTDRAQDFWEDYREQLKVESGKISEIGRAGLKGKATASRDALSKIGIIGVIDLDGVPHTLSLVNQRVRSRGMLKRPSRGGKVDGLKKVLEIDEQETGYFAIESKDGKPSVQEMIITPVTDPDTGKKLGLFVRGTAAETSAERFLDRYASQFGSESKMESGVFLDGEFYSRLVDGKRASVITAAIEGYLGEHRHSKDNHSNEDGRVELSVNGEPFLMLFKELNASSQLPPTWQVVLFPLSDLKRELGELRLIGSGMGVVALLLGFGIAILLSRNLTIPIRELNEGTRHIKEGDFAKRVRVYSGDEVGELAASFNSMAEELEQKDHYRQLLKKVSDEVVAQAMIDGSLDLELGGELKTVSVLFCDIRGFTALTEHMHPTGVIEMLNDHMTTMTRIVQKNSGVVDKFVGDEIMAVFGALRSEGDDATNAARCAVEMIVARKKLNAELEQPIHIGIGIATGEVVAGCMGSSDRLNYTVLGARVNLAARLCGQAGKMESVIDDATLDAIDVPAETELLSDMELKGFSGAISAYRLNSMGGD